MFRVLKLCFFLICIPNMLTFTLFPFSYFHIFTLHIKTPTFGKIFQGPHAYLVVEST
jgi:hypothetical protein